MALVIPGVIRVVLMEVWGILAFVLVVLGKALGILKMILGVLIRAMVARWMVL